MDSQSSQDLMSMKECSPIMVFGIYVVVSGITLYMTRNNLKKFGDEQIDNLYSLYSWHEVKFIIVMGVFLYGLCQYKKENLAWIALSLPILYLVLKNLFVFFNVFSLQQNVPVSSPEQTPPKKDVNEKYQHELLKQQQQQQQHQQQQQQQQQQPQQQQQQAQQYQPVNKDIGGLTPPLNSYDPSNANLALF